MNKFSKFALTSIVALASVLQLSYAGAPNGATVAGSVTVTTINVPCTNAVLGNAANFLPANSSRIGLIIEDTTTTTKTNLGGAFIDVASNATSAACLAVLPVGGTYTNLPAAPVYQGALWFSNGSTNYTAGVIATGTVRCIEFNAAP
jgi:hypothetical protein